MHTVFVPGFCQLYNMSALHLITLFVFIFYSYLSIFACRVFKENLENRVSLVIQEFLYVDIIDSDDDVHVLQPVL